MIMLLAGLMSGAQDAAQLGRAYLKTPGAATHAALMTYARAHSHEASGTAAWLALAWGETLSNHASEALAHLEGIDKRAPSIADYVAYARGSAQFGMQNYAGAERSMETVWSAAPKSPLVSRASILAAKAAMADGRPKQALEILRDHYGELAQPQGDLALGSALEATGDGIAAATYYQRVYYRYPLSTEADQADAAAHRLHQKLGETYPPAMPQAQLGRLGKLLDAGASTKARREAESLISTLGGAERDTARVLLGAAEYQGRDSAEAYRYLKSLQVASPEADAERLYYTAVCARRLNNQDQVHEALEALARSHAHSKWRLDALLADANSHLVNNEVDAYDPLYRACYESFPADPRAAFCHWKVAWAEYIRRRPDAAEMLKADLRSYPGSENAAAALYFLGRLAQAGSDPGAARVYFDEILRRFPNYYYAVEARQRMKDPSVARAAPSAAAELFLKEIAFPSHLVEMDFEADPGTRVRLERARLLDAGGLDDWADGELRFGARTGDQPQIFAMQLAEDANRRSAPDLGIFEISTFAPGYLLRPLDTVPSSFWRLAFPLPYRADLERYARERSLDPYLVAAVVRQESAFNPKAISPSKAYGLTQILPSTGRDLSRKLKVRAFSTRMLFQPSLNLRMGTYYLRWLVDSLDGKWEAALASYNAGKTRAVAWLSWGDYREPAEFIETIPFNETRNYVQIVLRNAEIYRRLYGQRAAQSTGAAAPRATVAKAAR